MRIINLHCDYSRVRSALSGNGYIVTLLIGVTHAWESGIRSLCQFLEHVSCFLAQVFFWYQKLAPNRVQLLLIQVSRMCHPHLCELSLCGTVGSMRQWTFSTSPLALTKKHLQFWWLGLLCSVLRLMMVLMYCDGSTACSFDWSVCICASVVVIFYRCKCWSMITIMLSPAPHQLILNSVSKYQNCVLSLFSSISRDKQVVRIY